MSPATPNWVTRKPICEPSVYHVPFLNIPISVNPSPSKSAAIGLSEGIPNWKTRKVPLLVLIYTVELDGRHTAKSALPSPLKSPVKGMSPSCPQLWYS